MSFTIKKQDDIVIVELKNSSVDLSIISNELEGNHNHIIFDLLNLSSINEGDFKNFTKFGTSNTNEGSFVMIYKGSYKDDFSIVPSLEEAFDFIEMENIERMLK